MAHAVQASLFQHRLETAITTMAESVVRHTVVELPMKVLRWKNANAHKLSICRTDLSDQAVDFILTMLNDDWSALLRDTGKLSHYCPPGCCESERAFRMKIRQAITATLGHFFDVPLLYRWKHFDPAVQFCLRNTIIHGLLSVAWEATMNKAFDDGAVDMSTLIDADAADLPPAVKQKIRMGKVWNLLNEDGILAPWLLRELVR